MKDLRLVYFSSVKWMSSALWIFITLINWGCTSEDDMLHVTMKDGNKILVGSCPKFYDSEQSFIHSVSFPAMEDCQTYNVENIDYEINGRYSIVGYDKVYTGCWEMAKFGVWATKYGLRPNTVYYVATDVFTKHLPAVPEGMMIVPHKDNVRMGFCPGIAYATFIDTNDYKAGVCILQTGNKSIKYDSNGVFINININNLKEQLTWKFQIQNEFWD